MKTLRIICCAFLMAPCALNSSTITLRISPYPAKQHPMPSMQHPSVASHHTLDHLINSSRITGVFATYAGFLEASNTDGFIIFPRKHTNAKVNLLVTNQITPIVMFEQTIQNWQILPHAATEMYQAERTTDPETGLTYWEVSAAELPTDLTIPLETIIIIAEPAHMYIPIGISLTDSGPNLVLPTIYTRKGIHIVENSLYMLQLAHLFRPAHIIHTTKDLYYALQLHE